MKKIFFAIAIIFATTLFSEAQSMNYNDNQLYQAFENYHTKETAYFGVSVMGLPLRANSWLERKTNGLLFQIDFFPLDYFSGTTKVCPMQQLNSFYNGVRTNGRIPSIKESSCMFIKHSYYYDYESIGSVYGFDLRKDFEYSKWGFTIFRIHFLRDSWLFNSSIGITLYEEKISGGIYDTSHNHIGWGDYLHQLSQDYGFIQTYKGIGIDFQIWCLDFMYYHSDYSNQIFVSFGYPLSNILYWIIVKDDGFLLPN